MHDGGLKRLPMGVAIVANVAVARLHKHSFRLCPTLNSTPA
ncbi:MAG: hypothetical protein AB2826_09665 [Candidatus Thiodiazotropha sp.]